MPALAAPLLLVAARARRRPARWLMPALGIALTVAFAAGVAAEGVITGDQGARQELQDLSPLDRTVRVTWQGPPVTPGVDRRARALLRNLGLGPATVVTLIGPVRLSGVIVRAAAISPLERWLSRAHPGRCLASDCPVVLAGGASSPPRLLSADGVRLRVVGSEPLRSSVPLAFAPAIDGQVPVVVTGDITGLEALQGLSGVYRTHSWLAPFMPGRLHSWQLPALERRLLRAQAEFESTAGQLSLTAPFDGLDAARSQAHVAPERLLLVGGGAAAGLVLFVMLAAGGLRSEQRAEVERLKLAGARSTQWVAFVVSEAAWICCLALLAGAALGVLVAVLLASAAGEPVGEVLSHSVLTPEALLSLAGGWAAATILIAISTLGGSARLLDLLAVAAASVLIAALSAGSGDQGLTLLLAPLCCLAGAVILFRAAEPALRALERVVRRGPLVARLALVGLARAPALPSAAIAFVAVSIGLGGFALAYRATLLHGAADQAAARVPLDALVSPGPSFATPVELAPLARWNRLSRGTVLPVRASTAAYVGGSGSVTVPALGVPPDGLRRMPATSLSALAPRLRPPGPVRRPGPVIVPGTRSLSLGVDSPEIAIGATAELRDAEGDVDQVPLVADGRARIPAGRWELEALELTEPSGLQATNGHQNAENPTGAPETTAGLTVGPVRELGASGRVLASVSVGGWRAVGAATVARARDGGSAEIRFQTTGAPGVLRPAQPTDTEPVPVLTDPQTAAAAGPGDRIAMTVDELPITARVVGVLHRFATIPPGAGGFVIADQALLSAALDAQFPGQGRPDQLWIASAHLGSLRAALGTGKLAQLSAQFRADIERALRDAPIARGVLRALLAAAVLTGVLAVLGMVLALAGTFRDPFVERDLEEQGLGPRALRSELRARFALASTVGGLAGLALALLLTRLSVAAVSAAVGDAHPQPPLVTVAPWGELAAWTLGAIAVLAFAGWLATKWLIADRGAARSGEGVVWVEPLTEVPAP